MYRVYGQCFRFLSLSLSFTFPTHSPLLHSSFFLTPSLSLSQTDQSSTDSTQHISFSFSLFFFLFLICLCQPKSVTKKNIFTMSIIFLVPKLKINNHKIIKPLTLNKQFKVDNNEIDEQVWANCFTR